MNYFIGGTLGSALTWLVISGHWQQAVLSVACGAGIAFAVRVSRFIATSRPGPETWRDPPA